MRNVVLLESTMQQIVDHPELHDQRLYLSRSECGTTACFAGWACMLSGWTPSQLDWVSIPGLAARELGLDIPESALLFDPGNTRAMLQLMVKDLVNGDQLRSQDEYRDEAHSCFR